LLLHSFTPRCGLPWENSWMLDEADQEFSWHLGSVPSSPPVAVHWELNIGEPISDEEYASHQSSAGLLAETFSNSSFAALQERYNEFKDTTMGVAQAFESKQLTPQMIQSIGTRIDDVLTALRRFVDRTAHALSQRYGKESQEYLTFTQALSYEFDNTFPYRFAWHLRNYSDHQGSVPFHVKQESGLSPSGSVEQGFRVVVDSRTLLANYAWHSLVRPDLERINGEFSIEAVADGVQLSCRRVYCKTLLAQEASITAAMQNIREFARRAEPADDFAPVFVKAPPYPAISPVTVSPISTELADVAETALQQARVVAA
jgi:hypothetical protein